MAARAFIGTSGWNYKKWAADFFKDVPQKRWLAFCAQHFTGIEINSTFYRLQPASTFRKWKEQTPADFGFSLKGHRFVTHNKKLLDSEEPVRRTLTPAAELGNKLTAVVWQLSHRQQKNLERLERFLSTLDHWNNTRHAIEFRHASWFDNQVAAQLSEHRVAVCMSDAPDWPMWEAVTTDVVYIRLHGHTRKYASSYSTRELQEWARRIRTWLREERTVHVYFDNDAEGAAPHNAIELINLLK
jgi:uncharacterized protein YecE (DUF72 family)